MQGWETFLYRGGMAAIVWIVILAPVALRLMRVRGPALSFPAFRALIGVLLIAALAGFAGSHWNAQVGDSVQFGIRFADATDARMFGTALVLLGIAIAFTMIFELRRARLSPGERAAIVAANLFLVGVFAGIAIATSGWLDSPFSKSYWTIAPVALLLGYLFRLCFPKATGPESRAETRELVPTESGQNLVRNPTE